MSKEDDAESAGCWVYLFFFAMVIFAANVRAQFIVLLIIAAFIGVAVLIGALFEGGSKAASPKGKKIAIGVLVGVPVGGLGLWFVFWLMGKMIEWAQAVCEWQDGVVPFIIGAIVLVGAILGAIFALTNYFAKQRDVYGVDHVKETPKACLRWIMTHESIIVTGITSEVTELRIPDRLSDMNLPVTGLMGGEWNDGKPTGCFADHDTIVRVILPSTLTSIGNYSFAGSDLIESVYMPSVVDIGFGAFYSCGNLARISFPDNLKYLHGGAFCNCASLTKIELPDEIEKLELRTFEGCVSLRRVKLPANLKSIGEKAFNACANLRIVDLPEGLETIGDAAFLGCDEMANVVLPKSLKAIGRDPFSPLTKFLVYPGSFGERWVRRFGRQFDIATPTTIAEIHIIDESNISDIPKIPTGYEKYAAAARAKQRASVQHRPEECVPFYADPYAPTPDVFAIPEKVGVKFVDRVGEAAFKHNLYVKSVSIPYGVTTIENHAFCECGALEQAFIPESVTKIGPRAFAECDRLRTLVVPKGVTEIGKGAFSRKTCLCVHNESYAAMWARAHGQPYRVMRGWH